MASRKAVLLYWMAAALVIAAAFAALFSCVPAEQLVSPSFGTGI